MVPCPRCERCRLCAGTGSCSEPAADAYLGQVRAAATATVRMRVDDVDRLRVDTIPSEPPTAPNRDRPEQVVAQADRWRRLSPFVIGVAVAVVGILVCLLVRG